MLVIVSDLHLTDGTSGQTIKAGAFRVFRQRLRDLAYDASKRAGGRYEPIKEMDIVLLGDVLDLIRSTKWTHNDFDVKPWNNFRSPAFTEKIDDISYSILEVNKASLDVLKNLDGDGKLTPQAISLPPATKDGKVADVGWQPDAKDRLPVKVNIHYMVGNHDWFYHLPGRDYDQIRQMVVDAIGLSNSAYEPFPHDPSESPTIESLYAQHKVFARHGDIFDSFNYEKRDPNIFSLDDRNYSTLGDAVVVELLNRFPVEVKKKLGEDLPESFVASLREIDNVRPSLIVPVWIDGLLINTIDKKESVSSEIKRVWDELADEFLDMAFVQKHDSFHPFDNVDKLQIALKFSKGLSFEAASKLVTWLNEKTRYGGFSYYENALNEKAFQENKAQFIVYGHTHHYEIVPLGSLVTDKTPVSRKQMYLNSGTWRRVHEMVINPTEKKFIDYNVMTYFAFFKADERQGRVFETWSGTLDV